MTPDEFFPGLAGLAEVFMEQVSKLRGQAYYTALQDLTPAQWRQAVESAIRTAKYFPKPAELRDLAGAAETSLRDRARLAYVRFLRMLEAVGTHETVDFGDPALHATIDSMIGWHRAHELNVFDSYTEDRFCKLYEAMVRSRITAAPMLRGQHDVGNAGVQHFEHGELPAPVVHRMLKDGTIRTEPQSDQPALPAAETPALEPAELKALVGEVTKDLPEPVPPARGEPDLDSGEAWFSQRP